MAFNKRNYPEFSDIKIAHFDGYSPDKILNDILEFISNPAHAKYRFIDSCVYYMLPPKPAQIVHTDPEASFWVEVTLIYTT